MIWILFTWSKLSLVVRSRSLHFPSRNVIIVHKDSLLPSPSALMSLPSPFPFLFPLPKLRDLRRRRRPRICPLFPLPSNLRLPSPSFSSIKKYALNWTSRAKERRVRESQSLRGFLQIQIALEPPFSQGETNTWMVSSHKKDASQSRAETHFPLFLRVVEWD